VIERNGLAPDGRQVDLTLGYRASAYPNGPAKRLVHVAARLLVHYSFPDVAGWQGTGGDPAYGVSNGRIGGDVVVDVATGGGDVMDRPSR
jgi:hypothetical protein